MNRVRSKPSHVLKTNIRDLPYQIVRWQDAGATENAERAARILAESRAELARREAKAGTKQ